MHVLILGGCDGTIDDVRVYGRALTADGIACKHLHTSHAFHSPMMEPAIAPFVEIVSRIKLAAPIIPIISTVTGDWMQADEATNPQYWARHVRNTVRFTEAVPKCGKCRSGFCWKWGRVNRLRRWPVSKSATVLSKQPLPLSPTPVRMRRNGWHCWMP